MISIDKGITYCYNTQGLEKTGGSGEDQTVFAWAIGVSMDAFAASLCGRNPSVFRSWEKPDIFSVGIGTLSIVIIILNSTKI